MTAKLSGRRLPLILVAIAASAAPALAQTLPWPGEAPATGQRPWPGAPAAGPTAAPMAAPAPMAPPPMMAPPMAARPQANQECVNKFGELRATAEKLRDALDKVAMSARSNSEKKASREDVCKAVTTYAAAEGKWAKFTADNVADCGIPPEIAKGLRDAHAKTQTARKNICSAGPAGGKPAAPSLSDALGTTRMPAAGGSQSGHGTFDTLTGNAIVR